MDKPNSHPVLAFETARDWEQWLRKNHATSSELWIKLAKKNSGFASVSYEEAIEVALCYGWIDGQMKSLGTTHHLQRFTPRRPKSNWSKRNTQRVATLVAEGRMQPAGLAQVEAAKKDGRWADAYDSPSTSTVPSDLQAALNKNPRAKKFFATISGANIYAILFRLQTAKKPETRQARIEKFIAMLNAGQTIHPPAPARRSKPKPKKG